LACEQGQLPGRRYPQNAHRFTSSVVCRDQERGEPIAVSGPAPPGAPKPPTAPQPARSASAATRAASRNGRPASSAPRVLRITAHARIQRTGPEPLLSPLPLLIGSHTPRAAGRLQLGHRCRQMLAGSLQPAAHRPRPLAAVVAASSHSRRTSATDKTVIPVAATGAPPRSVSSTGTLAGSPVAPARGSRSAGHGVGAGGEAGQGAARSRLNAAANQAGVAGAAGRSGRGRGYLADHGRQ